MPRTKLTKTNVAKASCPADKRKITYADTETRGLVLEVRPTGGRTFYFRYQDPRGHQHNIKVGDATAVSLAVAREQVATWQNERARGGDPAEARREVKNTPRFDDFVYNQYLPYVRGYKRSAETDETLLRKHLIPAFGALYLDQITKYDLTCFGQRKHNTEGLAAGSTNRLLVMVRYIFNLAIDWGVPGVQTNPAARLKLFQVNNKKERFLSETDVQNLVAALREAENPDLENIVGFLLLTGARKSEALNAAWKDIDVERRLWTIPRSKSGSARHVPLSDGALRLLDQLPSKGASPYLFPNRKTGRPYKQVFNSWDRARRRAGLHDLRIHDLRHSFASFLINSGRSLYEVQKLLGHHSIAVTERYSHLRNDRLAEAAGAAEVVPSLPSNKTCEAGGG